MAYTSLERSINARKQPRDRRGRWVTTGARLRAMLRGSDGQSVSISNLRAVGGNDDGTKIRSYVTNNDFSEYGINEGDVLEVNSSNGELLTATLDREFLQRKGIDPDLAHDLPEDIADQPQTLEEFNITKGSELDKEMALGELTDEEDAEFRKEREAEPLAKLPPALAEQAKTGQEVSDIVNDEAPKKKSFSDGDRDLRDFLKLPNGTKIRKKGPAGTEGDFARYVKGEDGNWYKASRKTGKPTGKPLTTAEVRDIVSNSTDPSRPLEVVDEFDKTPFRDISSERERGRSDVEQQRSDAARDIARNEDNSFMFRGSTLAEFDFPNPYKDIFKDTSDEDLIKRTKELDDSVSVPLDPSAPIGSQNPIFRQDQKQELQAALSELKKRGIDPDEVLADGLKSRLKRREAAEEFIKKTNKSPDSSLPTKDAPNLAKTYESIGYNPLLEQNENGVPKLYDDLSPDLAEKYLEDGLGFADPKEVSEKKKRLEKFIEDAEKQRVEEYYRGFEESAEESLPDIQELIDGFKIDDDLQPWNKNKGKLKRREDREKTIDARNRDRELRRRLYSQRPEKRDAYEAAEAEALWNSAISDPNEEQLARLRELQDGLIERHENSQKIDKAVGAPINVGMDDIFFDDDDDDNSSFELEDFEEPASDQPAPAKVKKDPENTDTPVRPPSEQNTKEKLEAEKSAEPVEETTPKKSIEEISELGTAEEYIEDFDGLTPTEEQKNILNAIVKGRFRTVVKALAGTGKTTTLVAAAKSILRTRRSSRILSLQFNRKNAEEAGERMPSKNTQAVTVDAFAYRSFRGSKDARKLSMNPNWQEGELSGGKSTVRIGQKKAWLLANDDEIARYFTYDEMPVYDQNLNATKVASMVRQIVDDFSHGTDKEITKDLVKKTLNKLKPENQDEDSEPDSKVVDKFHEYAKAYWDNITSEKMPEYLGHTEPTSTNKYGSPKYDFKRVRVSNSHLTKMWALTEPDLSNHRVNGRRVDTVFFDEGQDAIPAVAEVLANQDPKKVQVIHVGDPNQAIYEWRGAINALDKAEANAEAALPLTSVRRFGPELAGPGNAALNLLGYEDGRVNALGEGGEILDKDSIPIGVDEDTMVLTRSNAGAIGEIAKYIADEKTVGVTNEFYNDIESAVYHLKWLGGDYKTRGKVPTNANGERVNNSDLAGLRSKKDLYQLAENDPDSRAAKYKALFERLGGGDFDAGLAYVEQKILPGITFYDEGGRPDNKISGQFTGKVGEQAVVAEDSRGNNIKLSIDDKFIRFQGPSSAYENKLKNGQSFGQFLRESGWDLKKEQDGKWYFRRNVQNYSEAYRARDLNAVLDQIPEQFRPKDPNERPKPDVKVSTTHRMKGLEADNVIIGDDFPEPGVLEDGKKELPSDEELRTAYVALTRARKRMSLGSLGWVRDYQGPEGVAAANAAQDRDANVGAQAWKNEIKNVAFAPSSYLDDDDFLDDDFDVDGVDEEGGLPEFNQEVRTTRRTNAEDIDPDKEDGAYIVDPDSGKNVRITDSTGDDENVFLDGYDEDGEDYQGTFPRGTKLNEVEFGEPVRREQRREPEPAPAPAQPEPAPQPPRTEARPIARKPEPGKKASQIQDGDELLDSDGNVIGKVTSVRKGKLGDGTEVVAVEHDGPEGKVVYARDEDVNLRRPGKPATPEQAKEDADRLADEIRGEDGTDLDVPAELVETPSFVDTWIKTKNGTYSKYFGGERWNVKENRDGTITLRPRSNPEIGSKKYGSWEELEADFANMKNLSYFENQRKLIEALEPHMEFGLDELKRAITANRDPRLVAELIERSPSLRRAMENGDLPVSTVAARFNRWSDSWGSYGDNDPMDEYIPGAKRTDRDYTPDPDADPIPNVDQLDERRQDERDDNKEYAEELERDAEDEDSDYEEEVEEEITPDLAPEPDLADEPEEEPEVDADGKVETPAGLIDEDLNRPDDGEDISERSPFSDYLADIPDGQGLINATPEQIKEALLEDYPEAKIREDGSIVIHRKTYTDDIGPDAGKPVKVELFVKETKNNTMVIGLSKEVDGQKETYYHYNDHNSLKSLTRGGGQQGAAGIEQQLDRLTRTEGDIEAEADAKGLTGKARATFIRREKNSYGGASGYFNYMRRNREAALNGAGGNQASAFKLRTPEEHAQMVLNGRSDVFQSVGSERYKKRFGKKASIYEAFETGDQEQAAAIYQQYVNSIPDTPEAKAKAKAFFEQSMREKFPGVKEKEMSEFLSFADSRVDSNLTATSKPRETHLDRQGKVLKVGDYVEWTNNEGEVSRGQVVELKAVENPNEGAYAYSDYAQVKFLGKTKPQALNTSNMKKSDDQNSPVNNYQHWVRNEELAFNRKDLIGWEYDDDNQLFYWRDTGEIVKDFRAEDRKDGDYERIQGEIYQKIANNPDLKPTEPPKDVDVPEEEKPSPDEGKAADEVYDFFDDGSPISPNDIKRLQKYIRDLKLDVSDPELEQALDRAKNPRTRSEYNSTVNKLNEIAKEVNLRKNNASPVTPTEKGKTGKAAEFEGVSSFEIIPRVDIEDALNDEEQHAPVKGSTSQKVIKPTPEAQREVENILEYGEDIRNRAAEIYEDKYRLESERHRANARRLQEEANFERAASINPGARSIERSKAEEAAKAIQVKADKAHQKADNLIRKALIDALEEQGVEFNKEDFDDMLYEGSINVAENTAIPTGKKIANDSVNARAIKAALQFIPRPIIREMRRQISQSGGRLNVLRGGEKTRGLFTVNAGGDLFIRFTADDVDIAPDQPGIQKSDRGNAALHELWHFAQKAVDDITPVENAYLYRRGVKKDENGNDFFEVEQIPGHGYEKQRDEKALKGTEFSTPYSGKVYESDNDPRALLDPSEYTEIGTTFIESMFGLRNNNNVTGSGRYAVGRDELGNLVYHVESKEGMGTRGMKYQASNVRRSYYNPEDGQWYQDSAFTNKIEVLETYGRGKGEADEESQNFLLGLMLRFGKTK